MSFGKRTKADYLLLKLDQINISFKVRGGVGMLDVAFIYSYEEGKWIRCTNTELAKKEIEDIPCVTLINYIGNPYIPDTSARFVFCTKHSVMERIESISHNRAVSERGCCFEGLLGFAEITIGYDGYYAANIFTLKGEL